MILLFNLVSGCNVFFSLSYWRAVADPQSLLEEKEAIEEKLAIGEYELRLAQEDISKLKSELQKKTEPHSIELSGKFFLINMTEFGFFLLKTKAMLN